MLVCLPRSETELPTIIPTNVLGPKGDSFTVMVKILTGVEFTIPCTEGLTVESLKCLISSKIDVDMVAQGLFSNENS